MLLLTVIKFLPQLTAPILPATLSSGQIPLPPRLFLLQFVVYTVCCNDIFKVQYSFPCRFCASSGTCDDGLSTRYIFKKHYVNFTQLHTPSATEIALSVCVFVPGYVPPQIPMTIPVPQRPPGCPPGLEYLTQVKHYIIHNLSGIMLKQCRMFTTLPCNYKWIKPTCP